MIAFTCSRCGGKLKLKKQFAGRSSKCPVCKQRFVVPSLDPTQAALPENPSDGPGMVSSGTEGDLTREVSVVPAVLQHSMVPARQEGDGSEPAVYPGHPPGRELPDRPSNPGQRYLIKEEIARGGMGVVLRAVDCDIRREAAVKFLLDPSDPKKKVRFIKEAQITGQLEHPNIVPIHELGVDQEKHLFFAMKMVKGRSLAQVLDDLRQHPTTAAKEYPRGRLLHVLRNVCNGLAYAHSRGVVHRDLKPANIMVGDFGEVYVMDWGLAKLLKGRPADPSAGSREREADELAQILEEEPAAEVSNTAVHLAVNGRSASTSQQSKVVTSREEAAALTQEGVVVGTPVYMPPEQAEGRMADIDERSDIYSLGAILYEVLTLQPPIENEGGYEAVLGRVIRGEIVPPEQLRPRRAGKPPRELAAVAMKALAKNPQDRYQTVESLRKDVERFQEGRSVSAKADTFQETAWKLIKRNKLVSAVTTILVVGVVWGSVVHWLAQREIEKAKAESESKQQELVDRTRHAVPALVVAARQVANGGNLPGAQEQVELALLYEPQDADAHLLRGQLRLAQKDWTKGRVDLEQYLQQRPNDGEAKKLLELCSTGKVDDSAVLWDIAGVLERQNVSGLAIPLVQEVQQTVQARRLLESLYQKQIEANWRGLGKRVRLEPNGQMSLDLKDCNQVITLAPLHGMQWNVLNLWACPISDLTPLHGMPLATLNLNYCVQVSDLSPLRGMPLTTLQFADGFQLRDLKPLHDLNLTTLNLSGCRQLQDLTPLQGMKLTQLNLDRCSQVRDLTPLKGMPLTTLNISGCGLVQDLTPLQGMKLTSLDLYGYALVRDLTPLKGMSLQTLVLGQCGSVRDLTPLQDMPLTLLNLFGCDQVRDLAPLQGMRLTSLILSHCGQVGDLTPLKGMPLSMLDLGGSSQVRDLTPLQGMDLTEITFMPKNITQGVEVLRPMSSLVKINNLAAEEFWKKYDAGEFK